MASIINGITTKVMDPIQKQKWHRKGQNKSEGARKRQKQSSHKQCVRKCGQEKAEAKEKLSNYQHKPYMEKKFFKMAKAICVDYDASDYPACSTGYVGLQGKIHKTTIRLEDLLGLKAPVKYQLIKWQGR